MNASIKKAEKSQRIYLILALLIITSGLIFLADPSLTGFLISNNLKTHSQELNLNLESDYQTKWSLEEHPQYFELYSVKLSGTYFGDNSFTVYLEDKNGIKYTILNKKSILKGSNKITGYAVAASNGNGNDKGGDSPGNSGNAPGQGGDSPGNSGNAPGQGGDSPGNSGNAPGQDKEQSKSDTGGSNNNNPLQFNRREIKEAIKKNDLKALKRFKEEKSEEIDEDVLILIDFDNICAETCLLPSGLDSTEYKLVFSMMAGDLLTIDKITYVTRKLPNPLINVSFDVLDYEKDLIPAEITIEGVNETLQSGDKIDLREGQYNLEAVLDNHIIRSISIQGARLDKQTDYVARLDQGFLKDSLQSYAIDGETKFESAELLAVAQGNSVYICRDWDFRRRVCKGANGFELKKNVLPGKEYSVTLNNSAAIFEILENISVIYEKIKDSPDYDLLIDSAEIKDSNLVVSFYHTSDKEMPITIEGKVNYTLSRNESNAGENVSLIVYGWNNGYFKLKTGDGSEIYSFGAPREIEFNPEIKDSHNNLVEYELEFDDADTGKAEKNEDITQEKGFGVKAEKRIKVKENKYKIKVRPKNFPVKSIEIDGASIYSDVTEFIRLDDVPEFGDYVEVYAIDPTSFNFTNATVTATAKGGSLYKCRDWNFEKQTCNGTWAYLQSITPGQDYIFILTPEDPGLAEVGGTFFDGFESGTLSTNNWTTSGSGGIWDVDNYDPYQGAYFALVKPEGAESIMEINVDTGLYSDVQFSFYAQTGGLDNGEYIAADWYNGNNWINVLEQEDIYPYALYNFSLPIAANNKANFKIRFRCSANLLSESCQVDNVQVTGSPIDLIPPSSVTDLASQSLGTTWIYWNWTNPDDSDFNHTEVWINGTFYQNVSMPINYYNASGLSENSWYQIQTKTVDYNGNVNSSWVNSTAQTLAVCVENWTAQHTTCNISDSRTKYYLDENSCETYSYLPGDNGSVESCNYCSYNPVNSSWSDWQNQTACQYNNTLAQNRSRIEYDSNYSTCYAITGLASDLWNSGNNNTHWDYQSDICDYIISTEFGGTDFNTANLSNLDNLYLTTSNGLINFTDTLNINRSLDLNYYIKITNNSIVINSTALPELNKSAILKLYDLPFVNPIILRDGETCNPSICTRISYSGGNLTFNVAHFTAYSAGEGTYCGDGSCNGEESCSSCIADCGNCGSEGSGGGGGGSSSTTAEEVCEENWTCQLWSDCTKGIQTRICKDSNNCNTTVFKPSEKQSCGTACEEKWACTEWESCESGNQTRVCIDANNCGGEYTKPREIRGCDIPSCYNNIQDNNETSVDCGGLCGPCPDSKISGKTIQIKVESRPNAVYALPTILLVVLLIVIISLRRKETCGITKKCLAVAHVLIIGLVALLLIGAFQELIKSYFDITFGWLIWLIIGLSIIISILVTYGTFRIVKTKYSKVKKNGKKRKSKNKK